MWTSALAGRVGLALTLAVFAVSSAEARPFSAKRDVARTEQCFGIYVALKAVAYGMPTERDKSLASQMDNRLQRIQPYTNAAADADKWFFVRSRRGQKAELERLGGLPESSPERAKYVDVLAKAAEQCDNALDEWDRGPPPTPKVDPNDVNPNPGSAWSFEGPTRPETNPRDGDPDAVTASLLDLTNSMCVPYVMGLAPIEKLVNRPGVGKAVDRSYGAPVVHYQFDGPGRPGLIPVPPKDFGIDPEGKHEITSIACRAGVDASPEVASQVAHLFRARFAVSGYELTQPHEVDLPGTLRAPDDPNHPNESGNVACIHGKTVALVTISGPYSGPFGGPPPTTVEVNVQTDRMVLKASGCIPVTRADLTPTPQQNWNLCVGFGSPPLDQQIAGCSQLIASRARGFNPASLYDDRGVAYYKKGQYDQAVEDFSKSIRLDPDAADVYDNRGAVYLEEHRYSLAIDDFQASLRINPDNKAVRASLDIAKSALAAGGGGSRP